MKNYLLLPVVAFIISFVGGISFAATYTQTFPDDYWISNSGDTPVFWADFTLPGEYDSSNVDAFTITLYGDSDNTDNVPIDVFLSLDGTTTYDLVASYDVDRSDSFSLMMDFISDELVYTNLSSSQVDVTSLLMSFAPSDFTNAFSVGYGCHFWHRSTVLEISQVPIPGAIWLLGSGFIGFLGFGKNFKK